MEPIDVSPNLDDYILDVDDFFNDYVIKEEKVKENYVVYKGIMKNTPQAVKIYRRPFSMDPQSQARFFNLITAFQQGIIIADNIFLGQESDQLFLYVVEPCFLSWNDKFIQLNQLLKLELDYFKKQRLFQNLVVTVKSLHALGQAHLEICPKNIWVEDQFLVYLRPFKIDGVNYPEQLQRIDEANWSNDSKYWYVAPEQFFKPPEDPELNEMDFASDVWSLGCVFADMFVSLTPLFQSIDGYERIFRYFEILGLPDREDVFYIQDEELLRKIVFDYTEREEEGELPLLNTLAKSVSQNEDRILRTLLIFDPRKRATCEDLTHSSLFRNYSHPKGGFDTESGTGTGLGADSLGVGNYPERCTFEPNGPILHDNTQSGKKSNPVFTRETYVESSGGVNDSSSGNGGNWWRLDPLTTPKSDDVPKSDVSGSKIDNLNAVLISKNPTGQTSRRYTDHDVLSPPSTSPNAKNNTRWSNSKPPRESLGFEEDPIHLPAPLNKRHGPDPSRISKTSASFGVRDSNYKNLLESDDMSSKPNPKFLSYKEPTPSRTPSKIFNSLKESPSGLKRIEERVAEEEQSNNKSFIPKRGIEASGNTREETRRFSQNHENHSLVFVVNVIEAQFNKGNAREGSLACRFDFNDGVESNSFFSNFNEIEKGFCGLSYQKDVVIEDFGNIEKILQKNSPLNVSLFLKSSDQSTPRAKTVIAMIGVAQIDLSLLYLGGKATRAADNNEQKIISGWHEIVDVKKRSTVSGSIKVEIKLMPYKRYLQGAISKIEQKATARSNATSSITPAKSYRAPKEISENQPERLRNNKKEKRSVSPPEREERNEKKKRTEKSQKESSKSGKENKDKSFDSIKNEMEKLRQRLRAKERKISEPPLINEEEDIAKLMKKLRKILITENDSD